MEIFLLILKLFKVLKEKNSIKPIRNDIYICDTPKILIDFGLKKLPIYYSRKHFYDAIKPKNDKKHHHGLNIFKIGLLPILLKKPALILIDNNPMHNGKIGYLTNIFDSENKSVVISIFPDGRAVDNGRIIKSNYLLTIYGENHLDEVIIKALNENRIIYYNKKVIQDIDRISGRQLSRDLSILESNVIIQKHI